MKKRELKEFVLNENKEIKEKIPEENKQVKQNHEASQIAKKGIK